jgi:hypothetical protein
MRRFHQGLRQGPGDFALDIRQADVETRLEEVSVVSRASGPKSGQASPNGSGSIRSIECRD